MVIYENVDRELEFLIIERRPMTRQEKFIQRARVLFEPGDAESE